MHIHALPLTTHPIPALRHGSTVCCLSNEEDERAVKLKKGRPPLC